MIATILVATPHAAFGELLRISLTDMGNHQVHLVQSSSDARLCSQQNKLHLAILDATLGDEPFVQLCKDLLSQQPGLRLVIIPPDNNANHPALGGLMPHGYLSRPFYLPDLTETVTRLLADREQQFVAPPAPPAPAMAAPPQDSLPASSIPTWLQEPTSLRSRLEKEMAGTRAIAAITGMHSGGSAEKLRAYAGSISSEAAQELSDVVFRYWNHKDNTDLMRFVRLDEDKKDYLVYATQILSEYVLILAFDTNTPLTQVRPQTKMMAQALASSSTESKRTGPLQGFNPTPKNNGFKQSSSGKLSESQINSYTEWITGELSAPTSPEISRDLSTSETAPQPLDDGQFYNRLHSSFPSLEETTESIPSIDNAPEDPTVQPQTKAAAEDFSASAISEVPSDLEQSEDENVEGQAINLSALLGSVPSPDPESSDLHKPLFYTDWYQDRSATDPIPTLPGGLYSDLTSNNSREFVMDPEPPPSESMPPEPVLPVENELPASQPLPPVEEAAAPRVGSGRPASTDIKTEPPVAPPGIPAAIESPSSLVERPVDPIEDTHPHLVSTISSLGQLEPVSPALSLLNYTCVLVPRLPQHYLTGELAERMAVWVQQLCLAFGWRLEGISIRPEYLQWTVQVAPAISPGNLVRIVRQRISQHIFSNYSNLADQNPSGDFWANGYLIVSGSQPPSAQLLRDYISQTRKRQGVTR